MARARASGLFWFCTIQEKSSTEAASAPTPAIDPGTVQGHLQFGTGRHELRHVQAVRNPGNPKRLWILLTTTEHNPNGATVRFLLDGVPMPPDAGSYQRLVLMFDGEDDDAVAAARERWAQAKAQGFEVTYWQPDEQGRWVKKA